MRDGRGGREECCSGVDGLQMPGDSDLSEVELSQYSAGLCYAVCNVCSYTYIPPFSTFVPRFVIVATAIACSRCPSYTHNVMQLPNELS